MDYNVGLSVKIWDKEVKLGRVVHLESAGKQRNLLSKSVLAAIRLLMQQQEVNEQTRDLAAYIALALQEISNTIDPTVSAWEKRGYWLKADRYRMEWSWAETLGGKMEQALHQEDWEAVAQIAAEVANRLANAAKLKRAGTQAPWEGAWKRLMSKSPDSQ